MPREALDGEVEAAAEEKEEIAAASWTKTLGVIMVWRKGELNQLILNLERNQEKKREN